MTTLSGLPVDFDHLFIFFIFYSVFGWVCEEIWCTVTFKKITKRGMLYGPLCPIYGFGAVSILYFLEPWRNTWVRLFIASVLLTSVLEYFTSWLLEKLFHAKWWDYSDEPFNLNGRCCLVNSCAFGVGGLALFHIMHPFVERALYSPIITPYIHYIATALAVILTTDILFTIRKLVDFATTMEKFKAYTESLRERFEGEEWFKGQSLKEMMESILQKSKTDSQKFSVKFLETLKSYQGRQKTVEFWLNKFPSLSSKEYEKTLEHFKNILKESWNEQKELIRKKKETRGKKSAASEANGPAIEKTSDEKGGI